MASRSIVSLVLLLAPPVALPLVSPVVLTAQGMPNAPVTVEVPFTSHDGHAMRGKLTLPATPGPHPVVVYVQTAEAMTIDMKRPLGGGRTFNYFDLYADSLPTMNVAFFRYEGRGVTMGDSLPRFERIDWPVYNTSTLENKVRDALAAVDIARQQRGIDPAHVILMGTSEGTLLAAEAATRMTQPPRGLVLYAVMPDNMREVFRYILTDGAMLPYRRAFDANDDERITRAEYEADPRQYRARVLRGVPFETFEKTGDSVFTVDDMKVLTAPLISAVDTDNFTVLDQWAKTSAAVSTPGSWFRDHFAHAPIWTFLSRLEMPVGLFHGTADVNTSVDGVRRLEAQAREAGKTNLRFQYFENADHSLNLGLYFVRGELPAGHRAIFSYLREIAR